MRPGARLKLIVILGLSAALGACAGAPSRPEVVIPSPEVLDTSHKQKAEALEREGHLRKALDEWKIALTINPNDATARERKAALEGRIERAVADRIRQGREALRKEAYLEARRHFLAALALDPANRVAFEALQAEVKETRFITHTVARGETLATIAERYYGDRSRSEVIWQMNQLPPNPRLSAGAVLKIPEIPGVPFVHPAPRLDTPGVARPELPPGQVPREEPAEVNPLLVDAREALDKGEFVVALGDVDKLLASNPQDSEVIDLKKVVLYRQGKSQLDQQKFEDSYRTFTQLVRLAPNYQDSNSLLGQARTRLIQRHYSEGLRFYREEKLEEAIAQWRVVLEYDPQHAEAKRNIEQAERLLKGLQQRQQQRRQ